MHLRDYLTVQNFVRYRYKIGAVLAFVIGIGITIWLAVWASGGDAPDGAQSGLLVLLAALFQSAAVWALGKDRPSLEITKAAVRHVAKVGESVAEALGLAEAAVDDGREEIAMNAVRELSWRLNSIQDQVSTNIEDWVIAYPAILPANKLETE